MIKYNLKCENEHEFESWFSDSNNFEKLRKKKLLECIFCNSIEVKKSIMSPRILKSKKNQNLKNDSSQDILEVKKELKSLRKFIEKNFEFVGDKFAKKLRHIYYDNKNKKNIYGTATTKERKELKEEGIDLLTIPWIDKEN